MGSADVIREHKRKYQERQLARNPLLHFYAGQKSPRIDLNTLFGLNATSAPEKLPLKSKKITPVDALSLLGGLLNDVDEDDESKSYATKERRVLNPLASVSAKLEKIRIASSDTRHATGQHACFIAFPMVVAWEPEKKAPIVAPLLLLPVNVYLSGKDVIFSRAGDIRTNVYFERWLSIVHNLNISFASLAESVNADLEKISQQDRLKFVQGRVKDALEAWRDLEGKSDLSGCLLPAPTRDDAKRHQDSKNPPRIIWSAACGVAEFKGQALNADLEELEKEYASDTSREGALRYFIRQVTLDTPEANAPVEKERFLVCESDPSQERAVWQHRKSEILVIEGPPGTGKSQTIVNMIADSLSRGERVAVFCEKRPALEVVLKRMGRLGELACLIDDPSLQRKGVITGLREEADWDDPEFTSLDRGKTTMLIEKFEGNAEEALFPLYSDRRRQYRFADLSAREAILHSRCAHILGLDSRTKSKLLQLVKQHHSRQPKQFQQELRSYFSLSEQAHGMQFSASPWRFYERIEFDSASWRTRLQAINKFFDLPSALQCQVVGRQHWLAGSSLFDSRLACALAGDESADAVYLYQAALRALSDFQGALRGWVPILAKDLLGVSSARMAELVGLMESHLGSAATVKAIRVSLKESEIGCFLDQHLSHADAYWADAVELAWCQYQLEELKAHYPGKFDSSLPAAQAVKLLDKALEDKQQADSFEIRKKFKCRQNFSERLKDKNLLRLKGSPKNGVRKTEIRDLYVKGYDHLKCLKPVLLARPEVACAVLPLERGLFDLVIIDEASQMFVAEAMPLLHRAKRVVVAGDSKQMPPSAFFSIQTDDADDEGDDFANGQTDSADPDLSAFAAAAGQISLLDAANELARGNGKRLLQIHYRSSFRELIEFSNQAFYEGRLQAPPGNPAARTPLKRPIVFESQVGEFKTGVNEQEAMRIVSWLEHLIIESPECSLGVIVMNAKQKERIEEILAEKAAGNRAFSEVLDAKRDQRDDDQDVGLFIRNVERVQGDERDIIILGTTYSGNSNGFGPLKDPENGRKRLNVAITRAKKGMVVLSSLNLDIERHPFDLVRDGTYVRQFLRYARAVSLSDADETERVLSRVNPAYIAAKGVGDQFDSPFEEEVFDFLRNAGFDVESQVGVDGFRIDLAVKHPKGGYSCGIECDGAQYHSGWRARTNDIWRQKILESKGWRIIRVWSTDWFNSHDSAKHQLLEKVRDSETRTTSDNEICAYSPNSHQAVLNLGCQDSSYTDHQVTKAAPVPSTTDECLEIEVGDLVEYLHGPSIIPKTIRITSKIHDPDQGLIAKHIPLASALLGKTAGEEAVLSLAGRAPQILKILKITKQILT